MRFLYLARYGPLCTLTLHSGSYKGIRNCPGTYMAWPCRWMLNNLIIVTSRVFGWYWNYVHKQANSLPTSLSENSTTKSWLHCSNWLGKLTAIWSYQGVVHLTSVWLYTQIATMLEMYLYARGWLAYVNSFLLQIRVTRGIITRQIDAFFYSQEKHIFLNKPFELTKYAIAFVKPFSLLEATASSSFRYRKIFFKLKQEIMVLLIL